MARQTEIHQLIQPEVQHSGHCKKRYPDVVFVCPLGEFGTLQTGWTGDRVALVAKNLKKYAKTKNHVIFQPVSRKNCQEMKRLKNWVACLKRQVKVKFFLINNVSSHFLQFVIIVSNFLPVISFLINVLLKNFFIAMIIYLQILL